MNHKWCSQIPEGIRLVVQITPNARKNEVIGIMDDMLKIRLQAQPIEGKANDALIRYIANVLDVPKRMVLITHGHTNKRKILEVHSCSLTSDAAMQNLFPS